MLQLPSLVHFRQHKDHVLTWHTTWHIWHYRRGTVLPKSTLCIQDPPPRPHRERCTALGLPKTITGSTPHGSACPLFCPLNSFFTAFDKTPFRHQIWKDNTELSVCSHKSANTGSLHAVCKNKSTSVSHSPVPDSLRPQGLEPARPLCPWDSPGTNTGVMPFPSPGDPPKPGIELPSPASPASQVISSPTVPSGNQFTPGSQLKESPQSVLWSNSLSYPILVPRKQCTHVCCPDFITGIRGEIKTKLLNRPLLVINMLCLGISLAVQELRLCLAKQRVCIWSLVGSVRSHMSCGQNTKMRNRSGIVTSIKTLKWTILKKYIF